MIDIAAEVELLKGIVMKEIAGLFLIGVVIIAAIALLLAWPTLLLWNYFMPFAFPNEGTIEWLVNGVQRISIDASAAGLEKERSSTRQIHVQNVNAANS